MRAIAGFVFVLLATLPCLAQQSGQKAETQDKTADYYPLKVGNKWHYLVVLGNGRKVVFLYQITRIEDVDGKRLARVEMVVNGEIKATEQIGVDASGVFRHRYHEIPISPPACILKYPVKEGETWKSEMKVGDQPATMIAKTGIREEVKVPTGTYQAIPVVIDRAEDKARTRITSWYAPDLGLVKQSIEMQGGNINMELLKFEPGK
jgi:hypothetical protein